MEIFFYLILFVFWSLFWSFASVVIYRLKSWEKGILTGRSHCLKCKHTLWFFELIPIVSWIKNLWKCKYCSDKISSIYPFLEVSTWILFVLIWYFLIDFNLLLSLNFNEIITLFFWLTIWFITIIYTFYDILFLEIHDWIMLFWIIFSIIFLILQGFWAIDIFSYLWNINTDLLQNFIWLVILLISILFYYIIMFKELSLKYDFLILFIIWLLNFIFIKSFWIWIESSLFINIWIWILIIFSFLFIQIAVSAWAWMWGWDLRIAILMGLLLWYSFSIEALFLTYIIWSILWILFIIFSKFKNWFKTTFNSQIPFWPFLALWFFSIIFWQQNLIEILSIYL